MSEHLSVTLDPDSVTSERISRFQWRFHHRAILTNTGDAALNVRATLTSGVAHMVVEQGSATFGDVAENGNAVSQELITTLVDRRYSTPDSAFIWDVLSDPIPNTAPTGNIAAIDTAYMGVPIPLDASGSQDAENDPLTYAWSVLVRPTGSTAEVADPTAQVTQFTPDKTGEYRVRLTVNDGELDGVPLDLDFTAHLPEPEVVAPEPVASEVTLLGADTAFLFEGDTPIQTDVAPNAIDNVRTTILRGRVLDSSGQAIEGAKVSVLNHPEWGETRSRLNGGYDLAVNGGARLTLCVELSGFLTVQRQVQTRPQDIVPLDDIALVPKQPGGTAVDLTQTASFHVVQGDQTSDDAGDRRSTLLIPGNTQVQAVVTDGDPVDLMQFTVRITEYTSGNLGKNAMPGDLPPQTAFTYAAECAVDEADAIGASQVTFSVPVIQYVDNFTQTPVGEPVPLGTFDRERDVWVPEVDGRVIKVVAVNSGEAVISMASDDTPASGTELATLGITTDELQEIGSLLVVGQSYWRMLLPHFTPMDANYPYGPPTEPSPSAPPENSSDPSDASDPNKDSQPDPDEDKPNDCNSQVESLTQTLGETLSITGTPYKLIYRSDRVPGRKDVQLIRATVTDGSTLHEEMIEAEATIKVAGQVLSQVFPALQNQNWEVQWDGTDAYGRPVVGTVYAGITISHRYPQVYYRSRQDVERSFAQVGGGADSVVGTRGGTTFDLVSNAITKVSRRDARVTGLAGWHIDVHHVYDPLTGELQRGDGVRRRVQALDNGRDRVMADLAALGYTAPSDGGGICADADGNIYLAEDDLHRITRIDTAGQVTVIAGTGSAGHSGDGGSAAEAQLSYPTDVAIDRNGNLYILDGGRVRVRRVRPDGVIEHVAGDGALDAADGNPAADVNLNPESIHGLDVDAGGSVYLIGRKHLYKIGADERIVIIAGTISGGTSALTLTGHAPALEVNFPSGFGFGAGIVTDADGTCYFTHVATKAVYKLDREGFVSLFAGLPRSFGNAPTNAPEDGSIAVNVALGQPRSIAIDADGAVLIADAGYDRVFKVLPNGLIQTAVGGGASGGDIDGLNARDVTLGTPVGIALRPNGDVAILDAGKQKAFVAVSSQPKLGEPAFVIPSGDGDRLFHFGPYGRHLETTDAITGVRVHAFDYDEQGHLISIRDANDRAIDISRDEEGVPTAIVSPDGQTTQIALDTNGWLSAVTEPSGATWGIACTEEGLLTALTTPNGDSSQIAYDALGRLLTDTNPAGGTLTLDRNVHTTGTAINITDGEGRTKSLLREFQADGTRQRTETAADGSQATTYFEADGTEVRTDADGTVTRRTFVADPRFGERANYQAETRITLPSGLEQVQTVLESAQLSDPDDPLSVESYRIDRARNSVTVTEVYDATTRLER